MARFDFYNFIVEVNGTSPAVIQEVVRDFAWFVATPSTANTTDGVPDMQVTMNCVAPPYSTLPSISANVFTPRNVTFRQGDTTYVDYFGRGLAIVNRREKRCEIYATEFDLLREIAYLFLLSTVGQHLDALKLHRIHAMGVNYQGHGILLLLPSGGGKSTMTLELLRHPDFTLLSEDTPLIDRQGRIHPFPLRLGVKNDGNSEVPAHLQKRLRRMEFDPKTFVDLDFFRHRLSDAVDPAMILVGERNLGETSAIEPISRRDATGALIKYLVVGLGVYQGLEFVLEQGPWELAGKVGVAVSRLRNGLRLMSRTASYKFVLGRNVAKNSQTLIEFIERRFA